MAKSPSAKVSKTSGQGVSRLSYQQGYAMRQGNAPKVSSEKGDKRDYGKAKKSKSDEKPKASGPGFNVSYGDTLKIGDLKDIEEFRNRRHMMPITDPASLKQQRDADWRTRPRWLLWARVPPSGNEAAMAAKNAEIRARRPELARTPPGVAAGNVAGARPTNVAGDVATMTDPAVVAQRHQQNMAKQAELKAAGRTGPGADPAGMAAFDAQMRAKRGMGAAPAVGATGMKPMTGGAFGMKAFRKGGMIKSPMSTGQMDSLTKK